MSGISSEDVQTCLLDPMACVIEDDAQTEQRFVLVGMSNKARLLTVVYALRGESIRLISARRATKREGKDYAQGI